MAAPRCRWGGKGGERKVEAQREGGVEGRGGERKGRSRDEGSSGGYQREGVRRGGEGRGR